MEDLADRLASLSPVRRELLLRSLLSSRQAPAREQIPPRPPGAGPLPLSYAQERLWIVDRLQPGIPAYHLTSSFRVAGPLDLPAFSQERPPIAFAASTEDSLSAAPPCARAGTTPSCWRAGIA